MDIERKTISSMTSIMTPENSTASLSPNTKDTKKTWNMASISSLLTILILALAWFVGFASRLFAIVRFESIIHEFDPW